MLDNVLNAESVAVVGASKNETKRGYQTIRTLLDEKYEGDIYPVNPREKSILGHKCYARVSDIEGPVDLALVATPARTVPKVLEDCGQKGVHGAVILAGGFGETGSAGRQLEDEMLSVARKYSIRIIGPNTSGMMNLKQRMNLVGLQNAPRGDIALLSQSGNMALTLITEAIPEKPQRASPTTSGVGNEADIQLPRVPGFLPAGPGHARPFSCTWKACATAAEFLQQAHKTTIDQTDHVLLKSGRSSTGKKLRRFPYRCPGRHIGSG